MLDVEVKMPQLLLKRNKENLGGESSEENIDSPQNTSKITPNDDLGPSEEPEKRLTGASATVSQQSVTPTTQSTSLTAADYMKPCEEVSKVTEAANTERQNEIPPIEVPKGHPTAINDDGENGSSSALQLTLVVSESHRTGNGVIAERETSQAQAAAVAAAAAAASQTTEPFSWYQAPYHYPSYSQYQQYPPASQQNYQNYQEYPHYSQYSQYQHYQQYPQHHSQDSYWSSNSHAHFPTPSASKVEMFSTERIDELSASLMRLKEEAMASRETLGRLQRLEHKVEFIMDYLKHKLIQNDLREKNSRDDLNVQLKERLIKMQDAMNDMEQRFATSLGQ